MYQDFCVACGSAHPIWCRVRVIFGKQDTVESVVSARECCHPIYSGCLSTPFGTCRNVIGITQGQCFDLHSNLENCTSILPTISHKRAMNIPPKATRISLNADTANTLTAHTRCPFPFHGSVTGTRPHMTIPARLTYTVNPRASRSVF